MRGLRCVPLEEGDRQQALQSCCWRAAQTLGMLSQAEGALGSVRADGAELQVRLKLPFWKGRDSTHLLAWFKGYIWHHLSSWNLSYCSTNCSHKNICPRPLIKHIIWEYFTWLWPFGSVVLDTTMNKNQRKHSYYFLWGPLLFVVPSLIWPPSFILELRAETSGKGKAWINMHTVILND